MQSPPAALPVSWQDCSLAESLSSDPATWRQADLLEYLSTFRSRRLPGWQQQTIGQSAEGRPLELCQVGTGDRHILMWSQMHGDEPTHTAVLLNLLHFLATSKAVDVVQRILESCKLFLIPMLNPDGAERWTRHNAQGIDINRDAKRRQSPEGRALGSAVATHQPAFGFNLHNQNRRTAVDGTGRAAAVSLLVPPIDDAGTVTDGMRSAMHVASVFCRAVADQCPGMVSRYSASYMSRAFGESIQQTGCSTLLVEAGDWPGHPPQDLVQLHLLGLLNSLWAIAAGHYDATPTSVYESLPACSEFSLFDTIIQDATVRNGSIAPYRADLAINLTSRRGERLPAGTGRIVDLGDLHVHGGLAEIPARTGDCAPGGFLYCPDINPIRLPTERGCCAWLSQGMTFLLGAVQVDDDRQWDELMRCSDLRLPIHLGFLGVVRPSVDSVQARLLPRLTSTALLAVLVDALSGDIETVLEEHRVPRVALTQLPQTVPSMPLVWDRWQLWTCHAAHALGLHDRGSIHRESAADLLLFAPAQSDQLELNRLERVFVAGTLAWDKGEWQPSLPGRIVGRECGP